MHKTDHKFKKKYGQNFLQDMTVISKIISSVELNNDDLVIEIGPGEGVLTKELIKKCNVVAYEIDDELKDILSKINSDNLEIIWYDFLNRNLSSDIKKYKYNKLYLIANIPYYITTPIILKLIEENINIEKAIVMVQKEVAERFSAKPSTKDYSSITVFLNYYFEINKLFEVDRKCFYPIPNVDSAVISLKKKKQKPFVKDERIFFQLIKNSFQYKRKTLKNNLKSYNLEKIEKVLLKYNMDLSIRAESIPLEVFVDIVNNL